MKSQRPARNWRVVKGVNPLPNEVGTLSQMEQNVDSS